MATAGGHDAVGMTGAGIMTRSAVSTLGRVLKAPFSRRTWAEFWYVLVSVPLAAAGFAFTVVTMVPPLLGTVSAPGVRKFGDASRGLARGLLGEDVPVPPPLPPDPHVYVRTPDSAHEMPPALGAGAGSLAQRSWAQASIGFGS
jgi:hypothetical protein